MAGFPLSAVVAKLLPGLRSLTSAEWAGEVGALQQAAGNYQGKMVSGIQASDFKLQITSDTPEDTKQLGEKIGRLIEADTVVALFGDLGSGKTLFVQGLARGLDVPGGYYVTSPTYTLVNEYPGRHPLYHIDLYRIDTPVDFAEIGLDEILWRRGVKAIEWADRLGENLPAEHLKITFEILGEASRKIFLTAYGLNSANLLKSLEN